MLYRFLKRTLVIFLTLVFTANFASYSILSYIPPALVQHEIAYSIEHCPTHNAEPAVNVITQFLQGKDFKEGHEKRCVCSSCNLKRQHFTKTERFSQPVREELIIYTPRLEEPAYVKDVSRVISTRAPPFSSAVS